MKEDNLRFASVFTAGGSGHLSQITIDNFLLQGYLETCQTQARLGKISCKEMVFLMIYRQIIDWVSEIHHDKHSLLAQFIQFKEKGMTGGLWK
jgi:hypothetical protein